MTRRTQDQWRELIDEQAASDLSAAEFCRQRSVNPKYFSTRKRQLEQQRGSFIKVVTPRVEPSLESSIVKVRGIEFEVSGSSVNQLLEQLTR
jgi:hypothetical protein